MVKLNVVDLSAILQDERHASYKTTDSG